MLSIKSQTMMQNPKIQNQQYLTYLQNNPKKEEKQMILNLMNQVKDLFNRFSGIANPNSKPDPTLDQEILKPLMQIREQLSEILGKIDKRWPTVSPFNRDS